MSEKEKIERLISEIKERGGEKKRNPHYSLKTIDGEPAMNLSLWNDDSGEVLVGETIKTKSLLNMLELYLEQL